MKEALVHHEFPICKDKEVAMWESHGAKSKSTTQLVLRTQSGQIFRASASLQCAQSKAGSLVFPELRASWHDLGDRVLRVEWHVLIKAWCYGAKSDHEGQVVSQNLFTNMYR